VDKIDGRQIMVSDFDEIASCRFRIRLLPGGVSIGGRYGKGGQGKGMRMRTIRVRDRRRWIKKQTSEMRWIFVMGLESSSMIIWLFHKSCVVASESNLRFSKIFESVSRKSKGYGYPRLESFQ
jgi:hypothetical protein